jgi:hypothetical protein
MQASFCKTRRMVGSEGAVQRQEPKRRKVSRERSLAHSAMAVNPRAPDRAALGIAGDGETLLDLVAKLEPPAW